MNINFQTLTIENFDENLNGTVKAKLKFKNKCQISNEDGGKLGDSLRTFVVDKIKKGSIPFPEERTMMYAVVKDAMHGEVSCLINREAIQ